MIFQREVMGRFTALLLSLEIAKAEADVAIVEPAKPNRKGASL